MVEKFKNFWNKAWWSKAIVIFVILMIIGAFGSAGESSDDTAKKEDKTVEKKEVKKEKTETKKEVKKDNKKYVGDTVKSGDMEVTFQAPQISKTYGIQGAEDTAKGQYVTFQVTIANKGKKGSSASDTEFHLYVKGAKHDAAMVTSDNDQVKPLVFEELSPNTSVTSTLTFDVAEPVDLKNAYIEYTPSNDWNAKPVKIYIK